MSSSPTPVAATPPTSALRFTWSFLPPTLLALQSLPWMFPCLVSAASALSIVSAGTTVKRPSLLPSTYQCLCWINLFGPVAHCTNHCWIFPGQHYFLLYLAHQLCGLALAVHKGCHQGAQRLLGCLHCHWLHRQKFLSSTAMWNNMRWYWLTSGPPNSPPITLTTPFTRTPPSSAVRFLLSAYASLTST